MKNRAKPCQAARFSCPSPPRDQAMTETESLCDPQVNLDP
jgi:hypothetical protein